MSSNTPMKKKMDKVPDLGVQATLVRWQAPGGDRVKDAAI